MCGRAVQRVHRAPIPDCQLTHAWTHLAWLLLAGALLGIGGCTAVSGGTGDLIKLAVQHHRNQTPTAAAVAANPYYQLFARTSTGQGVLILGNIDGAREDWYGHGGIVVFIRHGRVVQTAGLPQNLEGLYEVARNPFARGLQYLSTPTTITYRVDWSGYRYGVPVRATLTPKGMQMVTILGHARQLLQIDESLDAPAAHWQALNRYWVDPVTGLIWKSEQHIAPGQTLSLVQLKPYTDALP